MKICNQLIAVYGIVILVSLNACEKNADDETPEPTITQTWRKSFGGNGMDVGNAVWQAADGGYILAGATTSNKSGDVGETKGDDDVFIVKTDTSGNKVWQKTYGGAKGESAIAITGTSDGGFVIVGNTYSNNSGDVGPTNGNSDIWIFKVDAGGNLVWQKTLGGSGDEYAYDLKTSPDGGFLVAGTTDSYMSGDVTTSHQFGGPDVWVVKLDASGNLAWQKAYGGMGFDYGYALAITSDGGFVVAGNSSGNNDGDVGPNKGMQDMWVIKADGNGKLLWQKTFGGADDDYAKSIVQSADGGYIITGDTRSNNTGDVGASHGSTDLWVLKLDVNGNLQWQKLFGGSGLDLAFGIVSKPDGGFVIGSTSNSNNSGDVGTTNGYLSIWVVNLSANGTIAGSEVVSLENNNAGKGSGGYATDIIGVTGSHVVLAATGNSIHPEYGLEPDMFIVKMREP